MNLESEARSKREDDLFRQMMLAAHPSKAKQIVNMFENMDREQQEAAVEQVMPQGHEEVENILSDITRYGISLRTDGSVSLPG